MRIAVDTNILVRVVTEDDPAQSALAETELTGAEIVAIPTWALCEFVWVLRRGYGIDKGNIAVSIRRLLAADNVRIDRHSVEAGLAMLDAGGDFADGVIAHQGRVLGGDTFVSFDRRVVDLLVAQGTAARFPAE